MQPAPSSPSLLLSANVLIFSARLDEAFKLGGPSGRGPPTARRERKATGGTDQQPGPAKALRRGPTAPGSGRQGHRQAGATTGDGHRWPKTAKAPLGATGPQDYLCASSLQTRPQGRNLTARTHPSA